FNALYPNLTYFTDAAVLGPANAFDVQPFMSVRPSRRVDAHFGVNVVWRLEDTDALYGAGFFPLVSSDGPDEQLATVFLNSAVNWQATDNIRFGAAFVYGASANLIDAAGGQNLVFVMFQSGLRF
ncbi:MAG: alginate export family protein, partial [Pseudomonadota bacterium]